LSYEDLVNIFRDTEPGLDRIPGFPLAKVIAEGPRGFAAGSFGAADANCGRTGRDQRPTGDIGPFPLGSTGILRLSHLYQKPSVHWLS
jgi:hypothetical protein